MPKPPAYKFPKTLGGCADRLADLKEARAELQKQADALEAEEKAIKEHVIQTMPKDDTGAMGKHHKVAIVHKDVPMVEDWEALYKHVLKTKDFSLLQRRVADAAVKERWEQKKTVPGVGTFKVLSVSLTKI